MQQIDRSGVIRYADARAMIPEGEEGVGLARRGTLDVRLNALLPPNKAAKHPTDEIYVVLEGHGVFVHNGQRDRVAPGDFLFVGAGTEHFFEDFERLMLWRLWLGPEGGEVPA